MNKRQRKKAYNKQFNQIIIGSTLLTTEFPELKTNVLEFIKLMYNLKPDLLRRIYEPHTLSFHKR